MQKLEISPSLQQPTRLLAVVVLYKMQLRDSPTIQTLLRAIKEISPAKLEITIFVRDNTPGGQDPGVAPGLIRYEAAPTNPGLAEAYNRALDIADAENYDWLLTLDQDTTLPIDFLIRITESIKSLTPNKTVGAIVPQVVDGDRNLSPFRFALGAIPRWFPYGHVGISSQATYALNSAATLRVAALRSIGGYNPMFPLDISDINAFHRLYLHGYKVFVAGDLTILHSFSLLDKHRRMSLDRYRAQLWDECAFWDINMGGFARLERFVRLIGRVCKDLLTPEEADFRRITVIELRRRLLKSRSERISEWTDWARGRYMEAAATVSDTGKTP